MTYEVNYTKTRKSKEEEMKDPPNDWIVLRSSIDEDTSSWLVAMIQQEEKNGALQATWDESDDENHEENENQD